MKGSEENLISPGRNLLPKLMAAAAPIIMIAVLSAQGRVWWCKYRDYAVYVNDAASGHTSQHFFDPYTFTHILHGVMFFWIAGLMFAGLSANWRFFVAVFTECAWEVFENSAYIIEKYRANTVSLDYFGDSVANSAGDVAACAAGFWIAFKLGWRRSLVFFLLTEIELLFWIHDSLLLNIVMLVYPLDSIKHWQMNF